MAATLLVAGWNPWTATLVAFVAGFVAGMVTGTLHAKFKINGLLAGILTMTALYSINLHIMGRSNTPLLSQTTFATQAETLGQRILGDSVNVFGWDIAARDASMLALAGIAIAIVGIMTPSYEADPEQSKVAALPETQAKAEDSEAIPREEGEVVGNPVAGRTVHLRYDRDCAGRLAQKEHRTDEDTRAGPAH